MANYDYRNPTTLTRKMKMKKTFDRVLIVGRVAAIMIAVGGAGYLGFCGGKIWQASKGASLLINVHSLKYEIVWPFEPMDADLLTNDAEKEMPARQEKKAGAVKNKAEMPPFPQSKPPVPAATYGGRK